MNLRKTKRRPSCQIDIAPLIDVVFLLIIFFMVVSHYTQIEVTALSLPKAFHQDLPRSSEARPLIINIPETGDPIIAGTVYKPSMLPPVLQEAVRKQADPPLTVLIRADRRAPWRSVSAVMNQCRRTNIHRVRVAAVEPSETEPAP